MSLGIPTSFLDARLQAIAGLCELCQRVADASSVDVAKHLAETHGLNIHWKTIEAALFADTSQISRKKRNNRWYYKPTASGLRLVSITKEVKDEAGASAVESRTASGSMGAKATPATKSQVPTSGKVRVFIGSSTEGLDIAEAIQLNLDYEAECVIWHQGVFGLSEGTLESLCNTAPAFDFAILVLTPDDVAIVRGEKKNTARDNVLLELGLFLGTLGRKRTFIVHPRGREMTLPSDLAGITPATFAEHADGNLRASLGATCTMIKAAIRKEGSRNGKG